MSKTQIILAPVATAAVVQPVVRSFLGYPFEVGPMILALLACGMVRAYRGTRGPSYSWRLDAPVSAITLLVTAGAMVHFRPDPLTAIGIGIGLGAAGEMIISKCEQWVTRYGLNADPSTLPHLPDTHDLPVINDLTTKLDDVKGPSK